MRSRDQSYPHMADDTVRLGEVAGQAVLGMQFHPRLHKRGFGVDDQSVEIKDKGADHAVRGGSKKENPPAVTTRNFHLPHCSHQVTYWVTRWLRCSWVKGEQVTQ